MILSKNRLKLIFSLTLSFLTIFLISSPPSYEKYAERNVTKKRTHHFNPLRLENAEGWGSFISQGEITVMMATSHYTDDIVFTNYTEDFCSKRCRLVSYRTAPDEFLSANVLVFHLISSDLDMKLIRKLHRKRDPNQIWVFYSMEPPHVVKAQLPFELNHNFSAFDNVFNWTLTYRTDSDITKVFNDHTGFAPKANASSEVLPVDKVSIRNKRHMAALISNCHSEFDRMNLIKEFQELGLEVDIFGKCGTKRCPGDKIGDECYKYLEDDYLFYAAFENSLCPDYFTEKVINIFNYNMVPVVIGGANYTKLAPPHSYIDVRSLGSSSQVVALLKEIAANETMFNNYFAWKGLFQLSNDRNGNEMFCNICKKLHKEYAKPKKTIQIYDDFEGWWQHKRPCGTDNFYKGVA